VPEGIKAGNCLLTAYDIEHAGMSNRTEQMRYMVKFIFFRTRNPEGPSWNGGEGPWQAPESRLGRHEHTQTWVRVWDWMRGQWQTGSLPAGDIDRHVSHLNGTDQQQRLAAIYSLGAMGEPALEPLVTSLLGVEGQDRIEPPYIQQADGAFETVGDPLERRWTEGGYIFQDEAFAFGCLGDIAVDSLVDLLGREDPWVVINAAFALGEIGCSAARAVPRLAALLDNPDHRVVRAILESIACIGSNTIAALPAIKTLLDAPRDAWEQDLELDHLVGDQVHFNAIYALLLSDLDVPEMEALLVELLDRPAPNVCVPATALEILLRRGSPEGVRRAIAYLKAHRWDDTSWPESGAEID
jgi:HEAT repeat protein